MAHPRCSLGRNRLAIAGTPKSPSFWGRASPDPRPGLHGRHFLCAPHRLPVESTGCNPILSRIDRSRPLPAVGASGCFLPAVEGRFARIRLSKRNRLVLAEHGREHDESSPRGGKRRGKILPIAPKAASSGACWSRPRASRWDWR